LVTKLIRFERCLVVARFRKSREINGNFSKRIILDRKIHIGTIRPTANSGQRNDRHLHIRTAEQCDRVSEVMDRMRQSFHRYIAVWCALAAIVATCATASSAEAFVPFLTEIVPASAPAGPAYPLRATISGQGFMTAGNIVQFGPVRIAGLVSADHAHITFAVPKLMPSRGEAPPAVLTPGEYRVTVTTASGTSNSLTFTLTGVQ
jgi:hypothetical protein